MSLLNELRSYLATVDDLKAASSILGWDQRTYMPPGGAEGRAHQSDDAEQNHT